MKQTAVEWFNQQLVDKQIGKGDARSWDIIFQQAKEMEKQQIIDAYNMATKTKYSIAMHKLGISTQSPLVENAEQYYKETYNLSQQDKP